MDAGPSVSSIVEMPPQELPDTLDNRRTLEQIMEPGNETCGDGTHWIEEREARSDFNEGTMAFLDSRLFRAFFAAAFGIAVFAVVVTGWWASTYMIPIRKVKDAVQEKLAGAESATFEHVIFNKATRVGCGYAIVKNRASGSPERMHFILFPNGELALAPPDSTEGDAAQQIAALEKQAKYAAQIVSNCTS